MEHELNQTIKINSDSSLESEESGKLELRDKLLNKPLDQMFIDYLKAQAYLDDMFNQETDQGTSIIRYQGEQKKQIRKESVSTVGIVENFLANKGCVIERGSLKSAPDEIMAAWQKALDAFK